MTTYRLLIDGQMVDGAAELAVINPATEQPAGVAARADIDQLNRAVAAAKAAFPAWSARAIEERRAILIQIADVIAANHDELTRILTSEAGKPLQAASFEIGWMEDFYRAFAAFEIPKVILEDSDTRHVEVIHRPLGVVAGIVPWNFPMSLSALKVGPALLCGNTCILKPAPTTPLATLRFAELVSEIVPAGVLNVIVDANDLGSALSSHPDIRKVTFTGSTATGRKVMAGAASTLKRLTLELGGNDPAIVLDDADPKVAAKGIYDMAFANSGQVCTAIKRIYVHDSLYDTFCEELVTLAEGAVVDDGTKQGTTMGPLQNRNQFEQVKGLLEDSRKVGKIVSGGEVLDRPGYFIRPTVVRDIPEDSRLVREEQFGPIVPVLRYSDVNDAIQRANDSEFGLGASVWTSDRARGVSVAKHIVAGTVWVNKHMDLAPHIPIRGAKQSAIGAEFGIEGIVEFTQPVVINS